MTLLQLLDHDRGSSTASVADACQSILAWLQVVHHVTHDSGSRHPYSRRHNKGQLKTSFEQSQIYFLIFFPFWGLLTTYVHQMFPGIAELWYYDSFELCYLTPNQKCVYVAHSCLPNGVSEGHGSPINIDFWRVNVQHLDVCKHNHAEGLVDLEHGDVILLQPCCFQSLSDTNSDVLSWTAWTL